MSGYESPTLKVRLELADSMLGMDCHAAAKQMVACGEGVKVLDAKWGREPTKWRETGGGWGANEVKLTDEEHGYVRACKELHAEGSAVAGLLEIIDRLTTRYPKATP